MQAPFYWNISFNSLFFLPSFLGFTAFLHLSRLRFIDHSASALVWAEMGPEQQSAEREGHFGERWVARSAVVVWS